MECPVCGAVADHQVEKTLPKEYELPGLVLPAVTRHAGRPTGYRIRMKTCAKNGCRFNSVEIAKDSFDALLAELDALRKRKKMASETIDAIRANLDALDKTLKIHKARKKD